MASKDRVSIVPGRLRQEGFLYRPVPGMADAWVHAIPFAQQQAGFRYVPINGEVGLCCLLVPEAQRAITATYVDADLLTGPGAAAGGALDFSDPANSGHIPGF